MRKNSPQTIAQQATQSYTSWPPTRESNPLVTNYENISKVDGLFLLFVFLIIQNNNNNDS
jgi:hypothetical protein